MTTATEITTTEPTITDGAALATIEQQPDPPYARYELRGVRVERVQLTDQEADEPGEEDSWNPWRAGQWITQITYERDWMQATSILSSNTDLDGHWREVVATDDRPTDEHLLAIARDEAARIAEEWRARLDEDAEIEQESR